MYFRLKQLPVDVIMNRKKLEILKSTFNPQQDPVANHLDLIEIK